MAERVLSERVWCMMCCERSAARLATEAVVERWWSGELSSVHRALFTMQAPGLFGTSEIRPRSHLM